DPDSALVLRLAVRADEVGLRERAERRRRNARAPDAGAPRPLHEPGASGLDRREARRDHGRRAALEGRALALLRAGDDGGGGDARRAADADPAGRPAVGGARLLRPRRGAAQARRLLHAPRAAGAATPAVLPER